VICQTLSMKTCRRDSEEEEHGRGGQNEEDDRKPQAVRRSAVATAAATGTAGEGGGGSESLNHNSSAGFSMSHCSLVVASLTDSLNLRISMSCVNSTASHSSSSHSA
jgi:hypothetical protein